MLNNKSQFPSTVAQMVDLFIRFVALFFLFNWCYYILKPFFIFLVGGVIIAIAVFPFYQKLCKLFGGRTRLSATLLTIIMLVVLIIPGWALFDSIYQGVMLLKDNITSGAPLIPPPNEMAKSWPAAFQPIIKIWEMASYNLDQLAVKYSSELASAGKWFLEILTNIGIGIFELISSIILAGIFLAYNDEISKSSRLVINKISGREGEFYFELIVATIRNVMKGVIGLAVIQSSIMAVALYAAEIPYAGIWTLICLILSIAQIGVWPVSIVTAIYMFSYSSLTSALIFTAWMILALISDNILRPFLLGRKLPVPMLVVFMGSIGGFIYSGFIGLFLGAVILSIVYKIVNGWLALEQHS